MSLEEVSKHLSPVACKHYYADDLASQECSQREKVRIVRIEPINASRNLKPSLRNEHLATSGPPRNSKCMLAAACTSFGRIARISNSRGWVAFASLHMGMRRRFMVVWIRSECMSSNLSAVCRRLNGVTTPRRSNAGHDEQHIGSSEPEFPQARSSRQFPCRSPPGVRWSTQADTAAWILL